MSWVVAANQLVTNITTAIARCNHDLQTSSDARGGKGIRAGSLLEATEDVRHGDRCEDTDVRDAGW